MSAPRLAVALLAPLALVGAAPAGFAPGMWTHQVDTISADVPGFPQWMVKMFSGSRTRKGCFTPQAAASSPQALLTQDDKAQCRTTRFSLAGGRIDYVAICTNKRFPEPLTVTSSGQFTPSGYTMSSTATGSKNGAPVKIVTKAVGKRIGECR